MADQFPSESGADGTGNRAVRIPAVVCRPPRRQRAANDNQPPPRVRLMRWGQLTVLALALVVLSWAALFR